MITNFPFSLILIATSLILLQFQGTTPAIPSTQHFNLSHFLYPRVNEDHPIQPRPHIYPFLKDVLESIVKREQWNLEDLNVLKLDPRKARYGTLKQTELRFRLWKKTELLFKFYDQVSEWNKFGRRVGDFETFVKEIGCEALLDSLRIEGPFELLVVGDDELSLTLPLNTSHNGLKRILVGEGISVEVVGAHEVSLFHTYDFHRSNTSFSVSRDRNLLESVWPSLCMPLLPVRIVGSASVVAYRTYKPGAGIKTTLLGRHAIELLPDKCYDVRYSRRLGFPDNLTKRAALLEKLLVGIFSNKTNGYTDLGYVRAKFSPSTVFRFRLELERDIKSNDTLLTTLADWKTKPSVERVWFEVVARSEEERLMPLVIKKVRPFHVAESFAWSSLMSNISFTNFPSILLPPEALTLDVKW